MPKRMLVEGVWVCLEHAVFDLIIFFLSSPQFLNESINEIIHDRCSQQPNCFMCWDYCSMLFKDRKKKYITNLMCTDGVCVSISFSLSAMYVEINSLACLCWNFSSPDVNLLATIIDTCWLNRCDERIFSINESFFFYFVIYVDDAAVQRQDFLHCSCTSFD